MTNDPATDRQAHQGRPVRIAVDCANRWRHGRRRPLL